MKSPLVTVIVPSYNHGKYIKQCVESIYSQTYTNIEVYIIDDGSTDETPQVLDELRLQYEFNLEFQKNIGLSNTLNKGFQFYAKGKYVTFCASDDYWPEFKLELQVKFMEENPDYAMVYGKAFIVDDNGVVAKRPVKDSVGKYEGGWIFESLFLRKFHPPVNYLFRRNVFSQIGYYDPKIWAEDFDMNLRIASKFKIGFINEFLLYYRRGINGKDKMLTFNTVHSHKKSIDKFMSHPLYNEAISIWRLKNFMWYSKYPESKLFASKYMILSIKYVFTWNYLISIFKLLFKWK